MSIIIQSVVYRGGAIGDGILDEKPGIETLPGKARNKRNHNGFEEYKRWLMEKLSCPISGNACIECGLYRGRHVHCSFFKRNLEMDLPLKEIERRRREAESELTAEKVWDLMKTPKKISKTNS